MLGEGPGKIGIIVESAQKAHINWRLTHTKKLLRLGKLFFNDVLLNGHTGIGFENPGQIHRIQMYLLRNILQKKTLR